MPNNARYVYSELAQLIQAIANCEKSNNHGWLNKHSHKLDELVKQFMPSGSGFDSGTTLDMADSHGEKLVFDTGFHHMNEHGMYDGWTQHRIYVTASLAHHFHLRISGRNRNGIKEYMYEVFRNALMQLH